MSGPGLARRVARSASLLVAFGVLGGFAGALPAAAQQTHVLMIVGLSGQPQYKDRFFGWASSIRDAAVQRLGIPEANFVWLGEDPSAAPGKIADRASVATIRSAMASLARRAGPDDRVVVVMIGHGTEQDRRPLFNLTGPDLTPTDLDLMLDELAPRRVAVVNTASASGDFVAPLAGPGRTLITATRSGRETNETWFAQFFAQALAQDGADTDKDGRISLLEAFQYARTETARYYTERQLLATEHALLEDDGDGKGTLEPGDGTKDGALAGTFYVGGSASDVAAQNAASGDPELQRLLREKAALDERVATLRARKDGMDPAEYDRQLEALLVDLALKGREIRDREAAK